MKGQTRRMSLMESLLNVAIGFGVALVTQILVFPWFGLHVAIHDNLIIGGIFTGVSIVRSYCVRRFFNWIHFRDTMRKHKEALQISERMNQIREQIENEVAR